MAALLRHGARRVGVSAVQRTRAAFTTPVAAQERRLLTTEDLGPRPSNGLHSVTGLIQKRKEELYNLISFFEGTPACNYKNRKLLKLLSVHVKPRPDDSLWRKMRALQRMKDAFRATVVVTGCTLAYKVASSVIGGEVAQTAKKLEQ